MFDSVLNTIQDILSDVFLTRDVLRAVIAVAVAVIAGMTLKELKLGKLVNQTLIALGVFALLLAIRNLFNSSSDLAGWLSRSINGLLNTSVGVLLVYFLAFLIVITLTFLLKQGIDRKK